jgi:COP9 signalosome complex subunit 1
VKALHEVSPEDADAILDVAWVDKLVRQVKAETDRLEAELKGYKNNLIKESIRVRKESPRAQLLC